MILFFSDLDKDIKDVIREYQSQSPEYVDHLRRIMKEFGIKEEDKLDDILERLKELGPIELETTTKVLTHIHAYGQMYDYITKYILMTYPDIDIDKISKISGEIDDNLSHIGFGERLFICNKLNRPFAIEFFKKELKEKKYLEKIWIDDINTMLLSIHRDMNIRKIEDIMKNIEEKLKYLKYEEKWMIYNSLGAMYIQDLILTLGTP